MPRAIHVLGTGDRIRLGSWRGDPAVAHLTPLHGGVPLSDDAIAEAIALAQAKGYHEVITAALNTNEQLPFRSFAFTTREELQLLSHDLSGLADLVEPADVRLRKARHRDRPRVLEVDAAAFAPFWRLDSEGLDDAIEATPRSRFRVTAGATLVGYAVTGRAGSTGYLQRLAVDPAAQSQGIGAALVVDSLRWLERRGATLVYVNTPASNVRAATLYRRLGFVDRQPGLEVLSRPLGLH